MEGKLALDEACWPGWLGASEEKEMAMDWEW